PAVEGVQNLGEPAEHRPIATQQPRRTANRTRLIERSPDDFCCDLRTEVDPSGNLRLLGAPGTVVACPRLPHQFRLPLTLSGVGITTEVGFPHRMPGLGAHVLPAREDSSADFGVFLVLPERERSLG